MRAGATAPALASCIACCIACMCGCPAACGGSNRQAGEACRSWPGGSPQFSCGARFSLCPGLADVAVATGWGGALCPLRHAGRGIRPGSIPRSGSLKSHNARLSAVTRAFAQVTTLRPSELRGCGPYPGIGWLIGVGALPSWVDRHLFRYKRGFVAVRRSCDRLCCPALQQRAVSGGSGSRLAVQHALVLRYNRGAFRYGGRTGRGEAA